MTDSSSHIVYSSALSSVRANVAPLMVGPAGCGKTRIAKAVAQELKLSFYYIGGADSAFQLKGFKDAYGQTVKTSFRNAYENGGVFLFDEMDASDPRALIALHAALDNGVLDAPDGMIEKHKDFYFMAAANTFGHGATLDYIGRNKLDGATLDRYAFLAMDYDEALELKMVQEKHGDSMNGWVMTVQAARHATRELKMRHIISMRASRDGAALLSSGMNQDDVFRMTLLKGLPQDDSIKLTKRVNEALEKGVEHIKISHDNAMQSLRLGADLETFSQSITETLKKSQQELDVSQALLKKAQEQTETLTGLNHTLGLNSDTIEITTEQLKQLQETSNTISARGKSKISSLDAAILGLQ